MDQNKIASDKIIKLLENEVFVFGSNLGGFHSKGAALTAQKKFGAIYGTASGLQGKSYGIPTKDRKLNKLTVDQIAVHVNRFIKFAAANPQLTFLVTEVGCGLAGNKYKDIAPLFIGALPLQNVKLPKNFLNVIQP